MKIWQIFVSSLLGLTLAGCRSDPEIAYLQRDNLRKEQEIERLRNRIEDMEEGLNSQPGIPRGIPPQPVTIDGGRSRPSGGDYALPDRTNLEPETHAPGGLDISPGTEAPSGEIPERLRVPGPSAPQVLPPSGPTSRGSSSSGPSQWSPAGGQPLADNSPVAQITLHPALTGGIGVGGQPGDEGLLVVVEPRDFGGNIINAPGAIAVALLDPALTGEQARLARWDFAATETQGMIHTGSQPGIHLRLPWTSTPAHDRLKVFVRYTTRDGRRLQAERLISVALNGPSPARREAVPDSDPAQTAARPQRPQWSPVR